VPALASGGTSSAITVGPQEDPNLVEVAVYGIAAIYERFDPAKTSAASTPGSPAPAGANPAAPGAAPK
jgi:hypothetical protein